MHLWPNMTKSAEFTIGVSHSLDWTQQIGEAWSGIGPALSGFVGLLTAIVGVGGIIGGFFLKTKPKKKMAMTKANMDKSGMRAGTSRNPLTIRNYTSRGWELSLNSSINRILLKWLCRKHQYYEIGLKAGELLEYYQIIETTRF